MSRAFIFKGIHMSQIEFKNVSKIYKNGHQGLKDINLNIEKGDFAVIVGLSGAGKSTLLRSINRLHDITEGDILIDGKSISKASGKELLMRRNIGMIFQHFNLVKRSSVIRNVLSGRVGYHPTWKMVLGLFPKEDKIKALESLDRVNILEKHITVLMNYLVVNNNVFLLHVLYAKNRLSSLQTNLLRH